MSWLDERKCYHGRTWWRCHRCEWEFQKMLAMARVLGDPVNDSEPTNDRAW